MLKSHIVIEFPNILAPFTEQLSQSWLFTIDTEALLSILFSVFNYVPDDEPFDDRQAIGDVINWLQFEGLMLKSENTFEQEHFVIDVVRQTLSSIEIELLKYGFLTNGNPFEYNFKRLLSPDTALFYQNKTTVRTD